VEGGRLVARDSLELRLELLGRLDAGLVAGAAIAPRDRLRAVHHAVGPRPDRDALRRHLLQLTRSR